MEPDDRPVGSGWSAGALGATALGLVLIVATGIWWLTRPDEPAVPTAPTASVAIPVVELPDLEVRLGGMTTTFEISERSFNLSNRNMGLEAQRTFGDSNDVFEGDFTTDQGLGPRYSATRCTGCHINNGRSPVPDSGIVDGSLFTALPADVPTRELIGDHFDSFSVAGSHPDGRVLVTWEESSVEYPDGRTVTLRSPVVTIADTDPEARLLLRVAPPVIGLGLLEAVPEDELIAASDPDDLDGDGISGRVRMVVDLRTGEPVAGRFGWRATTPSVLAQAAAAFANDMGILSSPLVGPDEAEIDDGTLELAAFYARGLAVPARRKTDDPDVRRGAAIFESVGCASCHTPNLRTGNVEMASVSAQSIWPYTDLLVHDMGEGLAAPTFQSGIEPGEWRTPPLWGLGLNSLVNGVTTLLHDGRARSIEEAILWHGGEGERARSAFMALVPGDRPDHLEFLENL